ncbi:hypothetical protein, partial [Chromatium okenii]|uniref:hypothetical protein n=1 Tax=Chromatium okenii TaxID=61644 RepID=UPI0026F109EA
GRAHNPSEDFGLVRYNADGSLDTTFGAADASGGHTGRVMTDFGDVDTAYSLTLQSDGSDVKILVAGKSGDTNVALARYSADGVLDTSFGSGGKGTVSLGDVPSQVDQTVLVD